MIELLMLYKKAVMTKGPNDVQMEDISIWIFGSFKWAKSEHFFSMKEPFLACIKVGPFESKWISLTIYHLKLRPLIW